MFQMCLKLFQDSASQEILEGHDYHGQLLRYMVAVVEDEERSQPLSLAGGCGNPIGAGSKSDFHACQAPTRSHRAERLRVSRGVSKTHENAATCETYVHWQDKGGVTAQVIAGLREMRPMMYLLSMQGPSFSKLWQTCAGSAQEPRPRQLTHPVVIEIFEVRSSSKGC